MEGEEAGHPPTGQSPTFASEIIAIIRLPPTDSFDPSIDRWPQRDDDEEEEERMRFRQTLNKSPSKPPWIGGGIRSAKERR
jgi:hypothetical protein